LVVPSINLYVPRVLFPVGKTGLLSFDVIKLLVFKLFLLVASEGFLTYGADHGTPLPATAFVADLIRM
jgi:hypothetical protein